MLPLPPGLPPVDSAAQPTAHDSVTGSYTTDDDTLSRLAAAAVKRQQYSQALQLLNQLVERNPQRAMYYSNRGLVQLWLRQPWAALTDCDRAIRLNPDLDQAYNNRAMCHAALGDLPAALNDYEQAVDLNPFNGRARINMGATLRQMGDLDRALDCFDEALMFHQLPEFIYAERGRTYHLRGDWNCAIADYRRTLTAATARQSSDQLQALVQRVKCWAEELLPQQNWA
ncbi:MAG: tetratricopeptide repeat protein [Nodosilinea sp. WJT8-NPBG4]|jgi:Tfp pilus assembly protein PilF|nr:tetratricopeptide repeat protein [Nodosilinea sp. WJT8-NPBG4]